MVQYFAQQLDGYAFSQFGGSSRMVLAVLSHQLSSVVSHAYKR